MIQYRKELPSLMKRLGLPMVGVELGVASGLNSYDLLSNGMELLYSVDSWITLPQTGDGNMEQTWHDDNYKSTVKLLKPFGEKSIILRGISSEMAVHVPDNSCGLFYHDAHHSYESVLADLKIWYPKVIVGGLLACHDYENDWDYGVKKAFKEFAEEYNLEIHSIPEDKLEDAGAYIIKK